MKIVNTKILTRLSRKFLFVFCAIFIHFQCGLPFSKKENSQDQILQDFFLLYLLGSAFCTNGLWARNVSTNRIECIPATKVVSGQNANIYLENALNVKIDLNLLIKNFDTKIHPAIINTFGSPSDINQDNRIDIFILDIRDGAKTNGPFVLAPSRI